MGTPTDAAYTKLYRFTNNTATEKGGVRAVNNSLEVIMSHYVNRADWDDNPYPTIGNILLSGLYCTKLKWFGTPVPIGGTVEVGWTTADNSCRLCDLRWVTVASNIAGSVVDAEQVGGVPGGGQVVYDPVASGYIWTITNDTGVPLNLSNSELTILAQAPASLEQLARTLWPVTGTMRTQQVELPHPDLVAMRVETIISEQITPLRAAVPQAQLAGYLRQEDSDQLLAALDGAETSLEAGVAAYDPLNPVSALAEWQDAIVSLNRFKALVIEFSEREPETASDYNLDTLALPPGVICDDNRMRINDSGQVAGTYGDCHGFVWDPVYGFVELPTPFGYLSWASDINDLGQVVGGWIDQDFDNLDRGCVWDPDGTGGYTYRKIAPLSALDGWWAWGINDLGQAVGEGYALNRMPFYYPEWSGALVWDLNDPTATIRLDGLHPRDINDSGQVVGYLVDQMADPYLVQPDGTLVDIRHVGGWQEIWPQAISDTGWIAGAGNYFRGTHACAWDPQLNFVHLCTHTSTWQCSYAQGVNDAGQVAGFEAFVSLAYRHATVWNVPEMTSIDLHQPDWRSSMAEDINNAGVIAGLYIVSGTQGDEWHLFRAIPIRLPEDLMQEWLSASDAVIAEVQGLPGPAGTSGSDLPPPLVPPPPPPPADPEDPPYDYVEWDEMQEQPTATLPPDSYTAFVVPDEDEFPDETLMLYVAYPATTTTAMTTMEALPGDYAIESVELYTADPFNPPVDDLTPPTIVAATATPDSLWPPNHKMVKVTFDVTVEDNTGDATWYIDPTGISSNQPEDGTGKGDRSPDWILEPDVDPQSVWLRAERSGKKNGPDRVYTVLLRAIDGAGLVSARPDPNNSEDPAVVTVRVPHDRGNAITAITSLAVVPTGGQTAEIVFGLSCGGQVGVEVLNIAGRRIKTVVSDRECDAGLTSLVWNCRSDRGLAVPGGMYLIRVTALTKDGGRASRLCPLSLTR